MNDELIPIKEEFSNICDPDTQAKLHDLVTFYSKPKNYNAVALGIFRGMARDAESQCNVIIRSMHEYSSPTREKKFTMRGFDKYEIDANGNLRIPDPPPKPPKIPDPEPIHMILLRHNMKKKGDEKEK